METFDRYSQFKNGDKIDIVSFGEIPVKDTDKFITYEKGKTRLDLVSYQYYGSSSYAWLILHANPQYGSLEFRIPDGVELRIPYPLDVVISGYNADVDVYDKLYGLEQK